MTTEGKAKAYDEALIKIRPLYERAKKEDCPIWSTYEYIFPELAESEDERIKNLLFCIVRDNKEVKKVLEGNGIAVNNVLTYLEKQKPAEWSEEDEMIATSIVNVLKRFEHRGATDMKIDWLQNKLKSLRPQPRQEWSEEDELHRRSIINTIEMCMQDNDNAESVLGYYETDIAWLKSLHNRPKSSDTWKPSEEQMEVLKEALETYKGFEEYDVMIRLYEQLKSIQ